jgi:hypothetical protein
VFPHPVFEVNRCPRLRPHSPFGMTSLGCFRILFLKLTAALNSDPLAVSILHTNA